MAGLKVVVYRITGVSPLLINKPGESFSELNPADDKPGVRPKPPTPAEDAAARAYKLKDGQLYLPTEGFRKCILYACKGLRIGKTGAATVLKGAVFPAELEARMIHPKTGKPITEYEVDVRRVVIGKASIPRGRPILRQWATDLALEVDTEILPNLETLTMILNRGGKICGVGDFRVEKDGTFGRFIAKLKTS
jgi:hypothetical protein